jgi:hypothetical protein
LKFGIENIWMPRYFDALRARGIAHVLNSWSKMPPLDEQIAMPDAFPADFTVVRALLRPGRTYEDAVATFQPYEKVTDEIRKRARHCAR